MGEEKANHEDELEKERREWEIAKFDYEQKNEMLQKKLVETVKLLDNKKNEAEAEAKAKYEKIIENQEKEEKEKLQLLNDEISELRVSISHHEERQALLNKSIEDMEMQKNLEKQEERQSSSKSPSDLKTASIRMRKMLADKEE